MKEPALQHLPIDDLLPYARNAKRHLPEQIAQIAASIKEFGFNAPVLVDGEQGIIAGHGRVLAARKLGLATVPCIVLTHLSEAQKRAYIIADNRLGDSDLAPWDWEMLQAEIDALKEENYDYTLTGFTDESLAAAMESALAGLQPEEPSSAKSDETYSRKIEAPIYEPTGPCPAIAELYEEDKYRELVQEIDAADLPKEVAEFLRVAATRHTVFKFRQIAEFYAHAPAPIQDLMEKSGLVIIDFHKAIEYGFVHLTERLGQIADLEGWNDEG